MCLPPIFVKYQRSSSDRRLRRRPLPRDVVTATTGSDNGQCGAAGGVCRCHWQSGSGAAAAGGGVKLKPFWPQLRGAVWLQGIHAPRLAWKRSLRQPQLRLRRRLPLARPTLPALRRRRRSCCPRPAPHQLQRRLLPPRRARGASPCPPSPRAPRQRQRPCALSRLRAQRQRAEARAGRGARAFCRRSHPAPSPHPPPTARPSSRPQARRRPQNRGGEKVPGGGAQPVRGPPARVQ